MKLNSKLWKFIQKPSCENWHGKMWVNFSARLVNKLPKFAFKKDFVIRRVNLIFFENWRILIAAESKKVF